MTTGRLNGLSCLCCVFSAVWGAAAQNQKTNKERGKEMDKSPGCDHQYPHRPKPSENSLKNSEFNICIIEVICTKRMLLKWCIFFWACVWEGQIKWRRKRFSRRSTPCFEMQEKMEEICWVEGSKHCCNCGFPENSSSSVIYVQYNWMMSFSEASLRYQNRKCSMFYLGQTQ